MAPKMPEAESSKPPIVPLPDEASMQQVIDPAKEFVILNQLQDVSGGFGWVACGGQNEALYYGEVQVMFLLPKGVDEGRYIKQIVKMMVSHGWMDGPRWRPVLRHPPAHQRGARRDHRRRLVQQGARHGPAVR